MSTYFKFTHVCNAEQVLGLLCTQVWEIGTFATPAGVTQSWHDARAHGWHIVNHHGEDKHLCPACFRTFLAWKDHPERRPR